MKIYLQIELNGEFILYFPKFSMVARTYISGAVTEVLEKYERGCFVTELESTRVKKTNQQDLKRILLHNSEGKQNIFLFKNRRRSRNIYLFILTAFCIYLCSGSYPRPTFAHF